jgi:hypothetical protein
VSKEKGSPEAIPGYLSEPRRSFLFFCSKWVNRGSLIF